MSARPALLLHCQHSLGLGHLVRSLALAEALAARFEVTVLSGGRLPPGTQPPPGVRLVPLPPLGLDEEGALVSRDPHHTVAQAQALRVEAVLAALRVTRPAVVVVELFPFGRKRFAGELVPLLEEARAAGAITVCSVRDILVGRGRKQAEHDERAAQRANRLLDAVLVHADPSLARLEESFAPRTPLAVPVHYTGFVVPAGEPAPRAPRDEVVVSAGGGLVGAELFEAAIAAHPVLWRRARLATTVIAGPFLPEDDWQRLQRRAGLRVGLKLVRTVPSLRAALTGAAVSVSQCGYNTALDVLRARIPALVVPFARRGEDEQTRRAKRLERLGAVHVLDGARLDGATLAAAVVRTRATSPPQLDLRLDGAGESARLLAALAAQEIAA